MAIKATSNFFFSSVGIIGHFPFLVILTPLAQYFFLSRLARTIRPLLSETSCSADGPPIKTATLILALFFINKLIIQQKVPVCSGDAFYKLSATKRQRTKIAMESGWTPE